VIKLENWSTVSTDSPYTAPELIRLRLKGKVYGHPKFENGESIITSPIVKLDIDNRIAQTYSGKIYTLASPDKKWVQLLRDTYGSEYVGRLYPN